MTEAEPFPPVPPPAPSPQYRLNSPGSVALATALGTPAAGGIVLAINDCKWGRKGLAVATVTIGLLATAVLGWLAWIAPMWVPAVVFLAPQVLGGYLLARWLQGKRFDAHIAGGGKQASNWVGAGIGLAVCAPLIAAFAAFILFSDVSTDALFDFQESVDMGQGQEVFYSRGATRNDAQRFGEALKDAGYFDGTAPSGVLIAGKAGSREISFIVGEGVWDDESWMNYVREVAEYVAPAIGGRPLTVRILDENLNEKKRFQVERTRGWSARPWNPFEDRPG